MSRPPDPWAGPWLDDARRLLRLVEAAAGEDHPPECQYCPLCQGIAVLRRSGPEILDRVADLAAGLAATLRAGNDERPADDERPAGGSPAPAPRPPSTVRIDVTD